MTLTVFRESRAYGHSPAVTVQRRIVHTHTYTFHSYYVYLVYCFVAI